MSNTNISPSIITLLTDFGLKDIYVGTIEGVIANLNPQLRLIHLTHEIPPQHIAAGSFCLASSYAYFPRGTVHLAIVDPGVGSSRRGVAIQIDRGYLVGPDNGLFTSVLRESPAIVAVELTDTRYWRSPVASLTFHGRDIFAPIAAHLASGVKIIELGETIDPLTLNRLEFPAIAITHGKISGSIQYIDRFGNLITNIPATAVVNRSWQIAMADLLIPQRATYSSVDRGELIALVGSSGWIEIAVNGGSASTRLGLSPTEPGNLPLTLEIVESIP
jgi:S-adenosyl-L-methionine hydrolase (adenosine-forming)